MPPGFVVECRIGGVLPLPKGDLQVTSTQYMYVCVMYVHKFVYTSVLQVHTFYTCLFDCTFEAEMNSEGICDDVVIV